MPPNPGTRKLRLNRTTVRALTSDQALRALGGERPPREAPSKIGDCTGGGDTVTGIPCGTAETCPTCFSCWNTNCDSCPMSDCINCGTALNTNDISCGC
jgi:hypothetical protein